VNFWATWCPPCIEELPLLDAFFRENLSNGWQVVGIAVDKPAAVREFLARQPLSFPSVMAGFAGSELSKSLGNINGGLPFTVTMGRDGNVTNRKLGKVSVTDLSSWGELK
jgi:thiol-disulfide isomerase/thioredoxin